MPLGDREDANVKPRNALDPRTFLLLLVCISCVMVIVFDSSRRQPSSLHSFGKQQQRSAAAGDDAAANLAPGQHHVTLGEPLLHAKAAPTFRTHADDLAAADDANLAPNTSTQKNGAGPGGQEPMPSSNDDADAEVGAPASSASQAARIDPSQFKAQRGSNIRCELYNELRRIIRFDRSSSTWILGNANSSSGGAAPRARQLRGSADLCNGALTLPLTTDVLRRELDGKRLVFLGDSIVRNTFVLTMARLCNAEKFDQCITRMPTYDYDIRNAPELSGPMGCVPKETGEEGASGGGGGGGGNDDGDLERLLSPHSSGAAAAREERENNSTNSANFGGGNMKHTAAKSPCYRDGHFSEVYIRGLTTRFVPQDKQGRKLFLRKGLIGPAFQMIYRNTTLIYVPLTKPWHFGRTGAWMARSPWKYLEADVIIASIGPHLRFPEVEITPRTIPEGFAAIRKATAAPILFAEFVQALRSPPEYVRYVDELMAKLRGILGPMGVTMIPQRVVTEDGFMLRKATVLDSDLEAPARACGYYDLQHPALRCQNVAAELMLAAALVKMSPPSG